MGKNLLLLNRRVGIVKTAGGIIWVLVLALTGFVAEAEEGVPSVVAAQKELQVKRQEWKKLRLKNPAFIVGDEKQPVNIRRRSTKSEEKKYYAMQVTDVRTTCVCPHAPLADGGTTARHYKNTPKRSLTPASTAVPNPDRMRDNGNGGGGNKRDDKDLCSAWKQWNDAMAKVAETKKANAAIDPVYAEVVALEKKLKDTIKAADEARKAKQNKK